MNKYIYSVKELRWSIETRSITANTLAEAKNKIAEDKYHRDSNHEDEEYSDEEYTKGENTDSIVDGWNELQDETIYPIIVLHRNTMFTINTYNDIYESDIKEIRFLPDDLRKHLNGEPTQYTYISPKVLTKIMESA